MGLGLLSTACRGPNWQAGPSIIATPRQVAAALNDPADVGPDQPFDRASVPVIDAPHKTRPCCAFGMDLKAQLGPIRIPGYEDANITSIEELGPHEYDNGALSVDTGRRERDILLEKNGLVYTCRGGFIDIAHIRDNADRVMYAAMQLARWLPAANANGTTFDYPEEGTRRRVLVKPVPPELLQRYGRWRVAAEIAGWVDYQLSIWHEIVTWYGWESTPGFSEKLSAFSPEDLYSNVLGLRIAVGIATTREAHNRDDYNHAMDAWIAESLRRLRAVPRVEGRTAMKAVDGKWWDSRRAVPDWKLVTRRNQAISSPLSGWLVTDAFPPGKAPPELQKMCAASPAPLPLEVPERLGDTKISDLVSIEFEFAGWVPSPFPLPIAKGTSVTQADFGAIIAGIRREAAAELGEGFDHPR